MLFVTTRIVLMTKLYSCVASTILWYGTESTFLTNFKIFEMAIGRLEAQGQLRDQICIN